MVHRDFHLEVENHQPNAISSKHYGKIGSHKRKRCPSQGSHPCPPNPHTWLCPLVKGLKALEFSRPRILKDQKRIPPEKKTELCLLQEE